MEHLSPLSQVAGLPASSDLPLVSNWMSGSRLLVRYLGKKS